MADSNIGSLPAAESLNDDSLLVAEQSGAAVRISGQLLKSYAKQGVEQYVNAANTAAQNALAAAQQAQEAVESVEGAAEEAAAAQAANTAAQAAKQAAQAAQAAAQAAAQNAANDAAQDVQDNLSSYVTAAQAAQAAAETARDQAQAIAGGNFLPLAGGTLTGPLVLSGAPASDLQAATKKYVDDNNGIFIATYNVTTNAEIKAAYDAGKVVFVKNASLAAPLVFISGDDVAVFSMFQAQAKQALAFSCQADTWSQTRITFENTANKATSLSADSTDTQYPSAKAVYDAITAEITGTWEESY